MATRTIEELRKERDELREQIDRADRENNLKLQNGTINLGDHSRIFTQIQSCRNTISELSIELFRAKITSLDIPGAQIGSSTKKLKTAIDNLDSVREFLSAAAEIISVVTKVINALAAAAAL
jgi:DNA repair exonuclease SbcCD ATPase subunit